MTVTGGEAENWGSQLQTSDNQPQINFTPLLSGFLQPLFTRCQILWLTSSVQNRRREPIWFAGFLAVCSHCSAPDQLSLLTEKIEMAVFPGVQLGFKSKGHPFHPVLWVELLGISRPQLASDMWERAESCSEVNTPEPPSLENILKGSGRIFLNEIFVSRALSTLEFLAEGRVTSKKNSQG